MKKNKELNTFITKLYAYNLFSMMAFILPFFAVMLNEKLTATQIAIVMIACKVAQITTEIPSGAIADKYNRKYVLMVSRSLNIVPLALWIFFPTFWYYLVGFIFLGLSDSLSSGCREAFIYDELNKFKRKDLFERVYGRGGALTSMGIFIASIGAFVFTKLGFGYNFLMFASILTLILSVIIFSTIKPSKNIGHVDDPENILSYMETLKKGVKYAFNHKLVLKMILFLTFINYINVGALEYIGVFYQEITNDLSKVAILCAVGSLAFALGRFSGEYLKVLSTKVLFSFFLIGSLLDIVSFSLYSYPFSIVTLVISTILICGVFVNVQARMNNLIPKNIRATTLSVMGFIEAIGCIICLYAFGRVVDYFDSYQIGFLTFVGLSVIGSAVFLISFVRDKNLK